MNPKNSLLCSFMLVLVIIGCTNSSKKDTRAEDFISTSYELVENWLQLPQNFVLGRPLGLGIDTDGNLYVFHTGTRVWSNPFPETTVSEKTIIKIDANSGELLESWGDSQFIMPHGLHIDHENNVWVTDIALHQIFKFNQDGDLLMTLGEAKVPGVDTAHFNRPTDVLVTNDGSVYVSDGYRNSRVVKFSSTGEYILEWGSKGNEPGQFAVPHGIGSDKEGNIYVADRNNNRIQKFDSEGNFIQKWQNKSAKQLYSLAIDNKRGQLFGIDYLKEDDSIKGSDIMRFDIGMNLQERFGRTGFYNGPITRYHDIEVGIDGSIYVGDILENRIQKFKLKSREQ